MKLSINVSEKLSLLVNTLYFFKTHFPTILGLGFIAALGRVIQLGGFGQITSWMDVTLEIVVESARVLLFLYVLGMANIKNGFSRIKRAITKKEDREKVFTIVFQKLKKQWFSVVLNLIGFLLIAWIINYLIDLLAYQTCLYLKLKKDGILAETSSEWTILLFFKNLTVIPLTLIFDTLLFLWLSNNNKISLT